MSKLWQQIRPSSFTRCLTGKRVFLLLFLLLIGSSGLVQPGEAQVRKPVKWSFEAVQVSESKAKLTFTATMDKGWHIYSSQTEEGGPLPASFSFTASDQYELDGSIREESPVVKHCNEIFSMEVARFDQKAVFTQLVKLKKAHVNITGTVGFMVCTDTACLLPQTKEFCIPVVRMNLREITNRH